MIRRKILFSNLIKITLLSVLGTVASHGLFAPKAHAQGRPSAPAEAQKTINSFPPYYLIPKQLWLGDLTHDGLRPPWNDSKLPYASYDVFHSQYPTAGLRLISFPGNSSDPERDRRLRYQSAEKLAEAGVIKDGDIILAFRPQWAGTVAYAEIQLGISHSGILAISKKADGKPIVQNLELPFEYNGNLDAPIYYNSMPLETGGNLLQLLHILRPNLNDAQRANVHQWIMRLAKNDKKVIFHPSYLAPQYNEKDGLLFVHKLARTALKKSEEELKFFCSEYVYAILALRNCDPKTYRADAAGPNSCVTPLFPPLPVIGDETIPGLAQGPEMLMKRMGLTPPSIKEILMDRALIDGTPGYQISSGHQDVYYAMRRLTRGLRWYYGLDEADLARGFIRSKANNAATPNYSPASFLIWGSSQPREIGYVGTLYYFLE